MFKKKKHSKEEANDVGGALAWKRLGTPVLNCQTRYVVYIADKCHHFECRIDWIISQFWLSTSNISYFCTSCPCISLYWCVKMLQLRCKLYPWREVNTELCVSLLAPHSRDGLVRCPLPSSWYTLYCHSRVCGWHRVTSHLLAFSLEPDNINVYLAKLTSLGGRDGVAFNIIWYMKTGLAAAEDFLKFFVYNLNRV